MKKILKISGILFIIIIIIGLYFTRKGYIMYKKALEEISIVEQQKNIKSKKNYYPLSLLPKTYKNAVISVEDHRFYKHNGIDLIAIFRAFIHDIKVRRFDEGGSTITQQLAKNIYFTQEKKIERKIAEVFMAFKLEKELTKDEIFELYLNTSYFGDGYYTVKEASVGYFNKEPKDMTDYEAIMLAGIPNAPSLYSPTKNLDLAKQRQKQVINKMVEYNYLKEYEKEQILSGNIE